MLLWDILHNRKGLKRKSVLRNKQLEAQNILGFQCFFLAKIVASFHPIYRLVHSSQWIYCININMNLEMKW